MQPFNYRSNPAISRSYLWDLYSLCPAAAEYNKTCEKKGSAAMNFGAAYHDLLRAKYSDDNNHLVRVMPSFAGTKGKKEAFLVEHAGDILVSQDEYDTLNEMVNALRPSFSLFDGQMEKEIYWEEEFFGRKISCKAMIDALYKYRIVDFKTCAQVGKRWTSYAAGMGYHVQAWWYKRAVASTTGLDLPFVFLVQEKSAPYLFQEIEADEQFLALGERHAMLALKAYVECVESGEWPGYQPTKTEYLAWWDTEIAKADEILIG